MTDLLGILSACGLVAVVGLGFVVWERYELKRLARTRRARPVRRAAAPPLDRGRAA